MQDEMKHGRNKGGRGDGPDCGHGNNLDRNLYYREIDRRGGGGLKS